MDQNKLNELKELAQKATPGPWDICAATAAKNSFKSILIHGNEQIAIVKTPRGLGRRGSTKDIRERDAAYIAAANPQVILALIADNERLRHKEDFYVKAMAEYHQVAKMAWDGEIPSPLPGHTSSEEKMIEQFEYLNCPACGGSGHVGDCDEAIQNLKCAIEKLRKENEELHANNYGPEILNDPQALTASYFAGAMAEGRKRAAEIETLEKEANWLAEVICKKHSDIRRNGFVPDCPTGRKCDNKCVSCWREAARKAVKGKDNK